MTLKTAKKRIKQLERDVTDLQFRFANLEESLAKDLRILYTRTEHVDTRAPYIANPITDYWQYHYDLARIAQSRDCLRAPVGV